jgi:hypothetical protein
MKDQFKLKGRYNFPNIYVKVKEREMKFARFKNS